MFISYERYLSRMRDKRILESPLINEWLEDGAILSEYIDKGAGIHFIKLPFSNYFKFEEFKKFKKNDDYLIKLLDNRNKDLLKFIIDIGYSVNNFDEDKFIFYLNKLMSLRYELGVYNEYKELELYLDNLVGLILFKEESELDICVFDLINNKWV